MGGLDVESREQSDMGTVARSRLLDSFARSFFHLPARRCSKLAGRAKGGVVYDPLWFVHSLFSTLTADAPLTSPPGLKRVKTHSSSLFSCARPSPTHVLYS